MRKLQINLGNKTFYTLIALAILLIIGGIVIAYSPGSQSVNPSVMGHTVNEIAGPNGEPFEEYIQGIVGTQASCSDPQVIFNSSNLPLVSGKYYMYGYNYTLGIKPVPAKCIEQICTLKQEIYNAGVSSPSLARFYTYSQASNGVWTSSYNPNTGGTNGNTASSDILPTYGYLYLRDDYAYGSYPTEYTSGNWAFLDFDSARDMIVYVC